MPSQIELRNFAMCNALINYDTIHKLRAFPIEIYKVYQLSIVSNLNNVYIFGCVKLMSINLM